MSTAKRNGYGAWSINVESNKKNKKKLGYRI
jgi:hypothetical protein